MSKDMMASNWFPIIVWGGPTLICVSIFVWSEARRTGMGYVMASLVTLGFVLGPVLVLASIAGIAGQMGTGEYKMDIVGLAINVVLMFAGAGLGVLFGTMNQNRLNRRAEEAARRNLRERLREAVQFNVDRMNDIESHLTGKVGSRLGTDKIVR